MFFAKTGSISIFKKSHRFLFVEGNQILHIIFSLTRCAFYFFCKSSFIYFWKYMIWGRLSRGLNNFLKQTFRKTWDCCSSSKMNRTQIKKNPIGFYFSRKSYGVVSLKDLGTCDPKECGWTSKIGTCPWLSSELTPEIIGNRADKF